MRLARIPGAIPALTRLGLIHASQGRFAEIVARQDIRWANAVRRIPLKDESVDALYSSHMLEHLDAAEAGDFLDEVLRVLVPGGIIRLAVPDLAVLVKSYCEWHDADALVRSTFLAHAKPRGLFARARFLVLGNRDHHWMYDGRSLLRAVANAGFASTRVAPAGTTSIPDPGELDLFEGYSESVYVEGQKPT